MSPSTGSGHGSTTAAPRLVVAAPGSSHGKTTVATGLMGALRAEGLEVASFKVGPDYIDPGYHALATGRPGRNLDPHLCHEEQIRPLFLHGMTAPTPADVAVVEGVMGLFDGQIGGDGYASTAHVAGLLQAPVVLVLDISSVSRTAAALVHGLTTFDPAVRLSGVVLNKAGSVRHSDEVVRALEATGVEVLGVLPRNAGIEAPSRHLGLVPAAERGDAAAAIARLSAQVAEHLDLTRVLALAHAAPPLAGEPWSPADAVHPPSRQRPVVAVAAGRAFTFRYAETDELLRAAGCEPVPFDPLTDAALPAGTAGVYLGGGFPEVHAAELSANAALRTALRTAVEAGVPTVAECAGLLYLCRSVDGSPMVGALDAEAAMTPKLTLRYQTLLAAGDSLLAARGARVTGHEFHRTHVDPPAGDDEAWLVDGHRVGFSADPAGRGRASLHASYLHLHWAGHPQLAQRFVDAVHAWAADPGAAGPPLPEPVEGSAWTGTPALRQAQVTAEVDLHHHGDSEVGDGLVDLAVNVQHREPPAWLADVITATVPTLGAYPSTAAATAAIAHVHAVGEDHVLPTSGAAEAFTLIARALVTRHPLVVHPQFTEPEAALRAAGHRPDRLVLDAADGFVLDPDRVPAHADLVVVGNPTNPTSVLHPVEVLQRLRAPGRVLVVDEAFLDAVTGPDQSLVSATMSGVLVLRSLTKTWGLAGLRAGYVVGDPALVAALATQQPPWSVSTPALAATVGCLSDAALTEARAQAEQIAARRTLLVDGLAELGLPVAGVPAAPFVCVDTAGVRGTHQPGWVREALRERGFAVRRGDTFPGLGPDWVRVAVRDPATTERLLTALATLLGGTR
ncbi:cobyrinic acid a,c-diamide synthase [Friedmanniella luteola]|uniref:Hydrogenobyrinate a,c-diamide synthase n=1 Tax=Friedmanniella luteola TaxID=546871 RepID=A0A1H2A231_9ACTN|nr:cobyrinate a,c-diamide synthase [Friedmanniella luteola]SDT39943.1 cobyrinic acid a,c-diamide synthase [Friedmanniella luteola]